ncbi:hypothetical protein SH661x_001408 [Planctomicrobium sp. SH661]|uniref:hypothetical protein n=1 Tax=Planctomicrobium sp. SH661 TaxID=3448124 RepID=UPI003F5B0F29
MRLERILACLLLLTSLGCQTMWGVSQASHGREDPAIDDPWIESAGNIARNEHPPEKVYDPLGLRNVLTSEKARQIERNVGVGD